MYFFMLKLFKGKVDIKKPTVAGREKSVKFLFTTACILAATAGIAVYFTLMSIYQPASVVVPVKDIKPLQKIESSDVKVVQVAKRDKHPKAVSDTKQVVGTFAKVPLTAGEMILNDKIVNNPEKMLEVYGSAGPDDTVIILKSNQATWPPTIKDGDYVSVIAVYPDHVEDLVRGARIVHNSSSWSPLGEFKAFKQAEATSSSSQPEILLMLNRDDGKRVLQATASAKGLYILPETSSELERMGKKNAGTM